MIKGVKLKKPVNSSLSKTLISFSGVGVLAPKFARQFEAHVSEIIANSENHLRVVVQNKIAIVKSLNERNKSWYGKIVNRILGVDYAYIELSGTELLALARLLNEDTEFEIHPKVPYLIPLEEAERIMKELNALK